MIRPDESRGNDGRDAFGEWGILFPMKIPSPPRFLRRAAGTALGLLGLATTASATWSIVVVDTRTQEVCIASATCLSNFDLQQFLPVVVPGVGVGAAQSFVDQTGNNRKLIWNELMAGTDPVTILQLLEAGDPSHQTRQYGLVSLHHPLAVTFTGTGAGNAKEGVVGSIGSLRYAIQGNVLAGKKVVFETELTLRNSTGDLGQRVMAAMETARAFGGDGRCSCHPFQPATCGSPPPGTWKSSHVAFIQLARLGDELGNCNTAQGCANGTYYLDLQRIGGVGGVDPVVRIQQDYDAWRQGQKGRPDQFRSTLSPTAERLPADGQSSMDVVLRLKDIDGVQIFHGGAQITVETVDGMPSHAAVGPVTDHLDGSYSFTLTAGTTTGLDRFAITADDGGVPVLIQPYLEVRLDAPTPLHVGWDRVGVNQHPTIPFVVNGGPATAGQTMVLLGTTAGTQPGLPFGGGVMPLNNSPFLRLTRQATGTALLQGSPAVLDGMGRAEVLFAPDAVLLQSLVGQRVDWAAVGISPTGLIFGPVGFDVVP